jgi:excisionase family DNA binding protein
MFHLIATREIDSVKIGRSRKIPRDALAGYARRLHPEPAASAEEPGGARPSWYPIEEAADLLSIRRTLMFRLVASGEISSFKIGTRRAIPYHVLVRYIERLLAEQSADAQQLRMTPTPSLRGGCQDRP